MFIQIKERWKLLNNFWIFVLKNWRSLSGYETLESAVSQEWIAEMSWFFVCWYKFRKAKSSFNNYWVGMVKTGLDLLDHETIKSGVFHNFEQIDWSDDWLIDWLILLVGFDYVFCLHVFFTAFFTVLPWWNYESIISRLHGFRFGFTSNHAT